MGALEDLKVVVDGCDRFTLYERLKLPKNKFYYFQKEKGYCLSWCGRQYIRNMWQPVTLVSNQEAKADGKWGWAVQPQDPPLETHFLWQGSIS